MQISFSTETCKCFKDFQVFHFNHFQFVIFQLASVNVVIIDKEKGKKKKQRFAETECTKYNIFFCFADLSVTQVSLKCDCSFVLL